MSGPALSPTHDDNHNEDDGRGDDDDGDEGDGDDYNDAHLCVMLCYDGGHILRGKAWLLFPQTDQSLLLFVRRQVYWNQKFVVDYLFSVKTILMKASAS